MTCRRLLARAATSRRSSKKSGGWPARAPSGSRWSSCGATSPPPAKTPSPRGKPSAGKRARCTGSTNRRKRWRSSKRFPATTICAGAPSWRCNSKTTPRRKRCCANCTASSRATPGPSASSRWCCSGAARTTRPARSTRGRFRAGRKTTARAPPMPGCSICRAATTTPGKSPRGSATGKTTPTCCACAPKRRSGRASTRRRSTPTSG